MNRWSDINSAPIFCSPRLERNRTDSTFQVQLYPWNCWSCQVEQWSTFQSQFAVWVQYFSWPRQIKRWHSGPDHNISSSLFSAVSVAIQRLYHILTGLWKYIWGSTCSSAFQNKSGGVNWLLIGCRLDPDIIWWICYLTLQRDCGEFGFQEVVSRTAFLNHHLDLFQGILYTPRTSLGDRSNSLCRDFISCLPS